MPQISQHAEPLAVALDDERHAVDGVVRCAYRVDTNAAEPQRVA